MTEISPGFRHKIGDALYELIDGDWDGNGLPDSVAVWPVAKITERFVYVYDRWGRHGQTIRLDRATLERDGKCYHRAALSSLHVRPEIDWPMVVVDVRDGRRELTA